MYVCTYLPQHFVPHLWSPALPYFACAHHKKVQKNFVEALNFLLKLSAFCFTTNSLLVPYVRTKYIRQRRFLRTSETQCSYPCFSKATKYVVFLKLYFCFIYFIYISDDLVPEANRNATSSLRSHWSSQKAVIHIFH